ncbi:SGT1 protein-domain-containing protein [Mariannaea sp. PMI_226]|nr:SGT1 protein-domain-containing protein [Mariannaea sp. PMI_226]
MASKITIDASTDGPDTGSAGFQRQLPDNCVEYLLFILDSKLDARKHLSQIETIRKSALKLANDSTRDYIWQKDELNLELKNEQGLVYLHGVTDYSDAVEDEWLIVYLLRQLTKSHPNLWVRVFDTDGEFLLVEAANALPKWLSPEIDHNRVWIHDGKLFIIPLKDEARLRVRNLSLPDAVAILKSDPDALVQSATIEAEAFYRLEKYPGQIADSIHHSLVTIPRKVAYILHTQPKSVAPAVEAFYLRDAISLRRVISPSGALTFPPDDLVTVSVKFSKVLFAQLRSQRFESPPVWQAALQRAQEEVSSADMEKAFARQEIGMKLTCGFEMLATNAEKSRSRTVRELAIVLEDLAEDGDDALPSNEEIKSWDRMDQDDSEAWMDINYEDFERELDGKQRQDSQQARKGFGDVKTQDDLRKIVSRFEAFLNNEDAGIDGAELDDMDFDNDDDDDDDDDDNEGSEGEKDKDVSIDEEEFTRMMREIMGLHPVEPKPPISAKGKETAKPTPPESEREPADEDDAEIRKLASQFEAELKGHNALSLDPRTDKKPRLKAAGESLAQASRDTSKKEYEDNAYDKEEEEEEELDIDYNLARNLLESFKSQAGTAGPTGNILGMMGFQLPRDEGDGEDEEDEGNRGQTSHKKRT